jgi:hypothetical protein
MATYAQRLMFTLTHGIALAIMESDADDIATLTCEARSLGIPVWVSAELRSV